MRKNIRTLIFIFFFVITIAIIYKNLPKNDILDISIGHNMPTNSSIHRGALYFKEITERDSNYKIRIKIYPNQKLGTDIQMIKMLQEGQLSIAITPTSKLTSLAPRIKILDIPYLFQNKRKLYSALDGSFGEVISLQLKQHHLTPISYWESGFKQMISKNKLKNIHDFSGKKFRIMQSDILKSQAIYLHSFPKFIDFHSLKTSLKRNEFEIQENSLASFHSMKIFEDHKYITITNHGYISYLTIMSDRFFKDIPEETKKTIETSLLKATEFQRKDSIKTEAKIIQNLKHKNIHVSIADKKFTKNIFNKMGGLYFRYQDIFHDFKDLINQDIIQSLKNTIAVGVNLSFSFEAKNSALSIIRGAELAIKEINSQQSVMNKKLILDIRDHGGFPSNGIHNIKSFSQNPRVVSILGGMHSPVILKEAKIVQENKIPYLIPWAAASSIISQKNPYHFRFSVRDEYAGKKLLQEASQYGNNIALILEDTPWGRGNLSTIEKEAQVHDIHLLDPYWFQWNESAFSQVISYLEEGSADAIIYVGNSPEGIHLIKKMTQIKKTIPIISHWGILGGRFWSQVQKELKKIPLVFLQTYVQPLHKNNDNKNLYDFFKRYQDHFLIKDQITPAPFATIHAYELIKMIAVAAEKGKSFDRESITSHLRSIENYQGLKRLYQHPFSNIKKQDALTSDDIHFAKFNEHGAIVGK